DTRRPIFSRSMRSNFRLSSISARSPLLRTSAMMTRAAWSTSSETSRLVARKAAKRAAKSADRLSRRIGIARCPAGRSPGFTGQWPAPEGASTLFGWLDDFAVQVARHVAVDLVGRTAFGDPGRAEIGQFGLKALDLQPERGPAGERQGHHAGGLISALEDDG